MAFAIDDLVNVIAHWSADAITGLSDGDPVDSLPDSISSWDLAQSSTQRPLYRPTGINSLPAIEFDGSNDWMITGTTKSISAGPVFAAWVQKLDTLKNYNAQFALHTNNGVPVNGSADYMSFAYSNGNNLIRNSSTYITTPAVLNTAAAQLVTGGCTIRGIVNLTDGEQGGIVTDGGGSPQFGGGTMYASFGDNSLPGAEFDGLLAEIVLWTESELCESFYIEGVLAHRYGITLPTTHPFYAAAPTTGPGTGSGGGLVDPLGGGLVI